MRWAVDLPAPSGGTGATVTVSAESWKGALAEARSGASLTKFRVDFEEDGSVRVHDLITNERFSLRPAATIGQNPAPAEAPPVASAPPAAPPVAAPTAPVVATPVDVAPVVAAVSVVPAPTPSVPAPKTASVPPPGGIGSVPPPSRPGLVPLPSAVSGAMKAPQKTVSSASQPAVTPNVVPPPATALTPTPSAQPAAEPLAAQAPVVQEPVAQAPISTVDPYEQVVAVATPAVVAEAPKPVELAVPAPATLLFQRNREASPTSALTYRERLLVVPPGTAMDVIVSIARDVCEQVRLQLNGAPAGQFISIAVFDHSFRSKPERPPLAILSWKDWRPEPELTIPSPSSAASVPDTGPMATALTAPAPTQSTPPTEPVSPPPPQPQPPPPVVMAPVVPEPPVIAANPPAPMHTVAFASMPPEVARAVVEHSAPVVQPMAMPTPSIEPAATPTPPPPPAPSIVPAPSEEAAKRSEEAAAAAMFAVMAPPTTPVVAPVSVPPPVPAPAAQEPAPQAPPPQRVSESIIISPELTQPLPLVSAPAAPMPLIAVSTAPTSPSRAPNRGRGDELLANAFEALQDLAFLNEADEACDFVVTVTRELLECAMVAVSLYDIDTDQLVLSAAPNNAGKGRRAPLKRGPRGEAALKQAPINLAQWPAGDLFLSEAGVGPALFVPATHNHRLFGVIELHRAESDAPFGADEAHAAAYVGEQLGKFLSEHSKRVGFDDDKQRK